MMDTTNTNDWPHHPSMSTMSTQNEQANVMNDQTHDEPTAVDRTNNSNCNSNNDETVNPSSTNISIANRDHSSNPFSQKTKQKETTQ